MNYVISTGTLPLVWLRTDRQTRFERVPTEFGPVTVNTKLSSGGKTLEVTYQASFRRPPKRVVLHVPPVSGLKAVKINGRLAEWDGRSESVELGR